MEVAYADLIQNVKTNPAWLWVVQRFKAGWKLSRKTGLLRAFFASFSKEKNISQRTGFHWTSEIRPARKPSSWPGGEARGRTHGSKEVALYSLLSVSHSSPCHFQTHRLCGSSRATLNPKATCHIWSSGWAAGNPRPLRTQLMPRLWVFRPWETLLLASQDSLWYKQLKDVEVLGFGNLQDRASRFNEFKKINLKAWAEGF